ATGQRREGDDPADALRRDVSRAVAQPALRPPQPAPRHVNFEDDDPLGAPAVALDRVQRRPYGLRPAAHSDYRLLRWNPWVDMLCRTVEVCGSGRSPERVQRCRVRMPRPPGRRVRKWRQTCGTQSGPNRPPGDYADSAARLAAKSAPTVTVLLHFVS